MKTCTKCLEEKKLTEFPVSKNKKDGRASHCRECRNKARREWGSNKKKELSQKRREWYIDNREHAIQYSKEYSLAWRYGISVQDYVDMLVLQGGVCKICGQPPSDRFALSVDHNHETGKVRGLLCGNCNFILGHSKDNPSLLRKAAEYLEES